ncbi:MAG TPA: ABC transporter ATP-binding protein [Thermodesulfobacteriota bacterium]
MREPVLVFDEVRFRYGPRMPWVLDGVSLDVREGEALGLVGPNAAGKTTVLRLATGFVRPTAGTVRLFGRPVAEWSRREAARRVALVPQEVPIGLPFRAGEVVLMGRAPHLSGLGFEGEADIAAAAAAMARAGVRHLADRPVDALSGGERRRVLLARALAQGARLLLLDEPASHLDLGHQHAVVDLVRDLAAEGVAVVAVWHDLTLAAAASDRLALLSGGRIAAVGSPEAVLTPEIVSAAYGCEVLVDRHPLTGRPRVTIAGATNGRDTVRRA